MHGINIQLNTSNWIFACPLHRKNDFIASKLYQNQNYIEPWKLWKIFRILCFRNLTLKSSSTVRVTKLTLTCPCNLYMYNCRNTFQALSFPIFLPNVHKRQCWMITLFTFSEVVSWLIIILNSYSKNERIFNQKCAIWGIWLKNLMVNHLFPFKIFYSNSLNCTFFIKILTFGLITVESYSLSWQCMALFR